MTPFEEQPHTVWVFTGESAQFPAGVFSARSLAEEWISRRRLTGILTEYPLDTGVFDWALVNGHFLPKRPEHEESKFIGRFTSGRLCHLHFQDGTLVALLRPETPRDQLAFRLYSLTKAKTNSTSLSCWRRGSLRTASKARWT